jgi:hypothetical protein
MTAFRHSGVDLKKNIIGTVESGPLVNRDEDGFAPKRNYVAERDQHE